jgi:hypothetical protein
MMMMMMMMMMMIIIIIMSSNPEGHEEAVAYLKTLSRHSSHRTSKRRRKLRDLTSHSGTDEDYSVLG